MSPFAATDPLAAYRVAREPFYQSRDDEVALFASKRRTRCACR
jgi:hypothetical protein